MTEITAPVRQFPLREVFDAIAHDTFELDCPQMELRQLAATSPEIVSGRGSIWLRHGPNFQLKVFADPGTAGSLAELLKWDTRVSGEVIPDEEFYSLTAVDIRGVEWHCDRVQISRRGDEPTLIAGTFTLLKCHFAVSTSESSVSLYFFDQPGVAYNSYVHTKMTVGDDDSRGIALEATRFETTGLSVEVNPVDHTGSPILIRVEFQQPGDLAPGVENRVVEALQFATFRPVNWAVLRKVHSAREDIFIQPKVGRRPPIARGPIPADFWHAKDFWNLFAAYLSRVLKMDNTEHYNRLSAMLRPLIQSETQELILIGLMLCTIIEGVLDAEFPDLAPVSEQDVAGIEATEQAIASLWGIDSRLKARMRGSIGQLKRSAPRNKLRELVAKGLVTQKMVDAWYSLRNASAHGSTHKGFMNSEKLFKACNTVTTLLNLLIFEAIGYSGQYVDLSSKGCPERSFPAKTAVSG